MSCFHKHVLGILTVAIIIVSGYGMTQRAVASEDEARAAFRIGKSYFKAGDYQKAVVELKKAYMLKPAPALLKFIGQTYYKMNKARLAIEHFRKYLEQAPKAPDRDAILSKIKELELVVGDEPPESENEGEGSDAEGNAPSLAVPGEEGMDSANDTGEQDTATDASQSHEGDDEVPAALAQEPTPDKVQLPALMADKEPKPRVSEGATFLGVTKWATLVSGVLMTGGGFISLALAKKYANEVEEFAKTDCPESNPDCGGNPNLDNPKVPYNESHHNALQSNKRMQTIGITLLIAGGVTTLSSAVLFFVDRKEESPKTTKTPPQKRLAIAPAVGVGYYGVNGEFRF